MMRIGVQTENVICDEHPGDGFAMLKQTGFDCADFSLNSYLTNSTLYRSERNTFFDQSVQELQNHFTPHKLGAKAHGITIHQMHMPYPIYVPNAGKEINDYLWQQVAPKSMGICSFFECRYIVVHGFKLAGFLGSEAAEWEQTEKFLNFLAPMAKEMGITVCVENLYDNIGGHLIEGPCCNIHRVVERIDRINDKYKAEVLGFCFDTGHANIVGLDLESFITALGDRLKVLHIHDNDGISDLHQIPFTFTKERHNLPSTDWEGFIRGLQKIKYNKVLNFETAPVLNSFPDEIKKDVLHFIANIGTYFGDRIQKHND